MRMEGLQGAVLSVKLKHSTAGMNGAGSTLVSIRHY